MKMTCCQVARRACEQAYQFWNAASPAPDSHANGRSGAGLAAEHTFSSQGFYGPGNGFLFPLNDYPSFRKHRRLPAQPADQ